MIAVFESDLEAQKHGVKLTTEQLWNYRFVAQHMDVMLECARADLDNAAFEMVSDTQSKMETRWTSSLSAA